MHLNMTATLDGYLSRQHRRRRVRVVGPSERKATLTRHSSRSKFRIIDDFLPAFFPLANASEVKTQRTDYAPLLRWGEFST